MSECSITSRRQRDTPRRSGTYGHPDSMGPTPGAATNIPHIAHDLTERQKTNALELMHEAAQTLWVSCSKLVNQGNDNWNIISKYLGDDDAELNRARLKMDSLVARDFDREKVRLDARNATLIAKPVEDKTI